MHETRRETSTSTTGIEREFSAFGEPASGGVRAAMLDEGLGVLGGLLSGREVAHRAEHYAVEGVGLSPLPTQRPRVPIWIGGDGDAALKRSAR